MSNHRAPDPGPRQYVAWVLAAFACGLLGAAIAILLYIRPAPEVALAPVPTPLFTTTPTTVTPPTAGPPIVVGTVDTTSRRSTTTRSTTTTTEEDTP
jgi:hypothetical protein